MRNARTAAIVAVLTLTTLAVVGLLIYAFKDHGHGDGIDAAIVTICSLRTAVNMYHRDVGVYPTDLNALVTQPQGAEGWKGPYLTIGVPKDPWGNPYYYRVPGREGHDFDIWSAGPDGKSGTKDDRITYKQYSMPGPEVSPRPENVSQE